MGPSRNMTPKWAVNYYSVSTASGRDTIILPDKKIPSEEIHEKENGQQVDSFSS